MAIQIFVDGWNGHRPLGWLPLPEVDATLDIIGFTAEGHPIMAEFEGGTEIDRFVCEPSEHNLATMERHGWEIEIDRFVCEPPEEEG